jgi:hypothetical protein
MATRMITPPTFPHLLGSVMPSGYRWHGDPEPGRSAL